MPDPSKALMSSLTTILAVLGMGHVPASMKNGEVGAQDRQGLGQGGGLSEKSHSHLFLLSPGRLSHFHRSSTTKFILYMEQLRRMILKAPVL